MFKFLKSKKGFTLVELMIVVVIMAILVAVAVPIYNAVTENARKKTCAANCRNIISQITNNAMSDPTLIKADVKTATQATAKKIVITTNDKGDDVDTSTGKFTNEVFATDDGFLNLFNSKNRPICPVAGGQLTVSVYPVTAGDVSSLNVTVDCSGTPNHDGTGLPITN